jgi:hypothetical protein
MVVQAGGGGSDNLQLGSAERAKHCKDTVCSPALKAPVGTPWCGSAADCTNYGDNAKLHPEASPTLEHRMKKAHETRETKLRSNTCRRPFWHRHMPASRAQLLPQGKASRAVATRGGGCT